MVHEGARARRISTCLLIFVGLYSEVAAIKYGSDAKPIEYTNASQAGRLNNLEVNVGDMGVVVVPQSLSSVQDQQQHACQHVHGQGCTALRKSSDDPRVVVSITTIKSRLPLIQATIDSVVEKQTRPPDAVYLSFGPDVGELPQWLQHYESTTCQKGILKVLRMDYDYGAASKLVAALEEGKEAHSDTLIIYGDDDTIWGQRLVEEHLKSQKATSYLAALGPRMASYEGGLLEATGTISLKAKLVPDALFAVLKSQSDACRASDDLLIHYFLKQAGVSQKTLSDCHYDWNGGGFSLGCGSCFADERNVRTKDALSSKKVDDNGKFTGEPGDWHDMIKRYAVCKKQLQTGQGS